MNLQFECQSEPIPNAGTQELKCNVDAPVITVVHLTLADLGASKLSKLEMENKAAAAESNYDTQNPWAET